MNENHMINNLREALENEGVSHKTQAIVLGAVKDLERQVETLGERLTWLEDKIDDADNEEIYSQYQRVFDLDHWSGGPS